MVAEKAREIIRKRGLKQKYIAEKAGYNEKQFSNILNGRKTIKDTDIVKIAIALNVTPNDLLLS